jgi:hypothetical protein
MPTIIPTIAAAGIAGWPVVPLEGKFASTFGMTNAMKTKTNSPMMSQLQEKMSNNALAQRRAMVEPIPSHTNATAKTP